MDADGPIPGQGLWLRLRVRSTLREEEKKKETLIPTCKAIPDLKWGTMTLWRGNSNSEY